VDVWTLPAAIFFGTMGMFAGVTALYLTGTRVRLFGHQAAEIVLFCLLFAIAVFAVIAAVYPTTGPTKKPTTSFSEPHKANIA
jgi:uncharacterized PurR-regulated membrane protein YhhQ (DUF165 family)